MGDPVCYMHLLDEEGRMPDRPHPLDEGEDESLTGDESDSDPRDE
jgi:hypothetical protein